MEKCVFYYKLYDIISNNIKTKYKNIRRISLLYPLIKHIKLPVALIILMMFIFLE